MVIMLMYFILNKIFFDKFIIINKFLLCDLINGNILKFMHFPSYIYFLSCGQISRIAIFTLFI